MTPKEFCDYCINRHDIVCNQKYDTLLPYSMHLRYVEAQLNKFRHLITPDEYLIVLMGCYGHDLIEDARVTYNDIVQMVGVRVADIIYRCTEEKGRNRDERHAEKYYKELSENRLAVFVKLCDIAANAIYSILTNSSMYQKHMKEHTKTYIHLYREEFKPIFDYLDNLFTLQS